MTTLNELKLELAEVVQRLRTTWLRERELARKRIADIAVEFQISSATIVQDVESAQRIAEPAPSMLRAPKVDLPLRSEGAVQYVEAKYRNAATGDSWTAGAPGRDGFARRLMRAQRWRNFSSTVGTHLLPETPCEPFKTQRVGHGWPPSLESCG